MAEPAAQTRCIICGRPVPGAFSHVDIDCETMTDEAVAAHDAAPPATVPEDVQ